MDITGPLQATGSGDTPSRRRIFTCRPATAAEQTAVRRKILSTLARRAYRGPVADADLDALMGFYETGAKKGGFEAGVQNALHVMLATPKFLFRSEPDPANVPPGQIYKLGDLELASRLSFFLWSSIPDDELLDVAEQRQAEGPGGSRRAGPAHAGRSEVAGAGQQLRRPVAVTAQSSELEARQQDVPRFRRQPAAVVPQETEMFFESIMREDRSVLDLLTQTTRSSMSGWRSTTASRTSTAPSSGA